MSANNVNVGQGRDVKIGNKTTIKIGSTIIVIGVILAIVFGNKFFNSPSKQIVGTW